MSKREWNRLCDPGPAFACGAVIPAAASWLPLPAPSA
jgi:hypothetical protein